MIKNFERILIASLIALFAASCGGGSTDPTAGDPGAGSGDTQSDAMSGDTSNGVCAQPTVVVDVSVADLNQSITNGKTLAVVDVRESGEHATGVIAGALLYPWNGGVLVSDHANLPSDRPLYVICASGGRSAAATTWLVGASHTCVINVLGGMNAWNAASYPTVAP